jgi:hypothetical protein
LLCHSGGWRLDPLAMALGWLTRGGRPGCGSRDADARGQRTMTPGRLMLFSWGEIARGCGVWFWRIVKVMVLRALGRWWALAGFRPISEEYCTCTARLLLQMQLHVRREMRHRSNLLNLTQRRWARPVGRRREAPRHELPRATPASMPRDQPRETRAPQPRRNPKPPVTSSFTPRELQPAALSPESCNQQPCLRKPATSSFVVGKL